MSPTGHLGIGFAVKRLDAKIPLWGYLAGAYVIDLIYIGLSFFKIEHFGYNPWSHSLLMSILWSVVTGVIVFKIVKHSNSSLLMSIVVFSHWILDFIVWDQLPLAFGSTMISGLGLYRWIGFDILSPGMNTGSIIATLIELGVLVIGMLIYWTSKKKSRKFVSIQKTEG